MSRRIQSMPTTDAYRAGWERIFGKKKAKEPVKVEVVQTETCQPCNEEHPKGERCPTCGRSLLLD